MSASFGIGGIFDRDDPAVGVEGVAAGAQQDDGPVGLGHPLDVFDQPRRRADADDQHARGQRVERAGMPDLHASQGPET